MKFFNHDEQTLEQTIEPSAGRLAIFSSGSENVHYFERVLSGERLVLAFWFTCNSLRQFEIFLDGKSHVSFAEKIKSGIKRRQEL